MIEIHRILCPVDFSEFSRRALAYAGASARWYKARLIVLHVVPDTPAAEIIPSLAIEAAQRVSLDNIDREKLTSAAERFVQHAVPPGLRFDLVIRHAPEAAREIVDQAVELKADLVVMGSHGRSGFERLLLGSVTEKVLRTIACPVMVVPQEATNVVPAGDVHFDQILCAVDFSESSAVALSYAMSLAEESDAHLRIVHVVELPPALEHEALLTEVDLEGIRVKAEAEAVARLNAMIPDSARTYCQLEVKVVQGNPYKEILRLAREQRSDLIVMGSHGRGALDQMLFGSNTHEVIRAAPCPVLTARVR